VALLQVLLAVTFVPLVLLHIPHVKRHTAIQIIACRPRGRQSRLLLLLLQCPVAVAGGRLGCSTQLWPHILLAAQAFVAGRQHTFEHFRAHSSTHCWRQYLQQACRMQSGGLLPVSSTYAYPRLGCCWRVCRAATELNTGAGELLAVSWACTHAPYITHMGVHRPYGCHGGCMWGARVGGGQGACFTSA
jgi:hypothetical protein